MKITKKIGVLFIITISFLWAFLIPNTYAQEWVYDGADTQSIPSFNIYPSEWYAYSHSMLPPENITMAEIVHGNVSDPFMLGNGTCVWGKSYFKNLTSDELYLFVGDTLICYWNESVGFQGSGFMIPVGNDGKVSENILNNMSIYWADMLSSETFEHNQVYPTLYSIAFWNDTYNNAYFHFNYTDDGILTGYTSYLLPHGNLTLYSQPAQLPPVFSFAPEHSSLIVNSTTFILDIVITAADNNNDGMTDTDYLMRHLQGSTWTSWGTPPNHLLWNLGPSATAGNYTITIEVKNMYGVTQEQIEVQYDPPGDTDNGIPGFSIILIPIALLLGISFLIHKNRKKI